MAIFVPRNYIDCQPDSVWDRYTEADEEGLCQMLIKDKSATSIKLR